MNEYYQRLLNNIIDSEAKHARMVHGFVTRNPDVILSDEDKVYLEYGVKPDGSGNR